MALPRLIFVTGKGGTGKSTVAAALAHAMARHRPTTLADLDRRSSAASMLGVSPAQAVPVAAGDSLEIVALSPRAELEAFIRRIVPVAAISRRMLKSRTFGYVTAALPGLEAFLLLERLRIMAGDAALEDRYVVVDAPASGSALELLSVASGIKGIAPSGTLNRLAHSVHAMLTDPDRFGVVLTVTPEDLAIREALELAAALRDKLQIATVAAIINRAPAELFRADELKQVAGTGAHALLARRRHSEREAARVARRELRRGGVETVELPMLYSAAMAIDEIAALGRALEAELIAR